MAGAKNTISNNIAQRRRAIYMGLKQYLEGDDLLNAMCIWQQQYAHLPKFAITNFVRRITDQTSLSNNRAAVHLSLTSSLMLADDNLGEDPLPGMRRYLGDRLGTAKAEAILGGAESDSDTTQESVEQTDRIRVFEQLLGHFLNRIAELDSYAVRAVKTRLLQSVPDIVSDDETLTALNSWLQGQNSYLQITLDGGQLQPLLHSAYVAACDRLGPVQTDQLLTDALNVVERTHAGRRFSPRELL